MPSSAMIRAARCAIRLRSSLRGRLLGIVRDLEKLVAHFFGRPLASRREARRTASTFWGRELLIEVVDDARLTLCGPGTRLGIDLHREHARWGRERLLGHALQSRRDVAHPDRERRNAARF